MEKTFYIYVLELEGGFWYVGRTHELSKRLKKHTFGGGSAWTKLHQVKMLHSVHIGDEDEERLTTMDLMKIHGFDKVRGAGYSMCTYPEGYPTPALDAHVLRAS